MSQNDVGYFYPKRMAAIGVRFTGGAKNGNDIVEWLYRNHIPATWEQYDETIVKGEVRKEAYDLIEIRRLDWEYQQVNVGEWIILETNGTITVLTNEQKEATYRGRAD